MQKLFSSLPFGDMITKILLSVAQTVRNYNAALAKPCQPILALLYPWFRKNEKRVEQIRLEGRKATGTEQLDENVGDILETSVPKGW